MPFSGGLDSLAGTLKLLTQTDMNLCLVSHQTHPGMKRTQEALFSDLNNYFKGRLTHYKFICHLSGIHAIEESQRTRSFLYLSIAFAIAKVYSQKEIYVFENGITSLNFQRREDLINARASRTTHPQSMGRLENFLRQVSESDIKIKLPFIWKTKADIIKIIKDSPDPALISSTVSCTKVYHNLGPHTHCGQCFQCIDRRISSHAVGVEELDYTGLYALDCITKSFTTAEGRTSSIDYIRQAKKFARSNIDNFYNDNLTELANLHGWIPDSKSEMELVEKVWQLCKRHGEEVQKGLLRMRELYDDPYEELEPECLLRLISNREYLKPEVNRLVDSITKIVKIAIPEMFRINPPIDEPDLNEKIRALLNTHYSDLRSEHPTVSFACARVIPDHLLLKSDLLIESKYIRDGTSPAKVTEGIASDLTKYPPKCHILFLVLDKGHAIQSDFVFIHDIELWGRCTVCILR